MRRLLIQDATIITMDPRLGDLRPGSILIEGERIAAVGARINADGPDMQKAERSERIATR